ncbi:hypothetical protein Q4490_12305 [Neptunomonas phycophila]|uniref:Uncharacterized protein n=1 Tax=Neptunomonas phycophila TaxID=1572645 RepID=A0AAW7XL18_9GAMM|nr:hypothetical protein [Neptunomonas phycophila]MDO6454347.1 hypothetical protein [Neptunomonas phycophila]
MGNNPNFLRSKLIVNILVLFLYLSLFVETVNGVALYLGFGYLNSFFSAVKLFVCVAFFLYLLGNSKYLSSVVFVSIMIMLLSGFLNMITLQEYSLRTVPIFFKIMINFLIVFFAYDSLKKGFVKVEIFKFVIFVNYSFLVVNITFSFFGLGFENYKSGDDVGFGGTGFLYAGNEVGVTLMLSNVAMLICFGSSLRRVFFLFLISTLCGLLVMSKSSILGVFVTYFLFILRYNMFMCLGVASVVVAAGGFYLEKILSFMNFAINRWLFLIDSYGISNFILGGNKRVEYIGDFIDQSLSNPFIFVFGRGWIGEAENNFFDLFEAFGLLGVFLFFVWLFVFSRYFSINLRGFDRFDRSLIFASKFSILMVAFVSFIAGHTIQSSLVTPFLIILPILFLRSAKGSMRNE